MSVLMPSEPTDLVVTLNIKDNTSLTDLNHHPPPMSEVSNNMLYWEPEH